MHIGVEGVDEEGAHLHALVKGECMHVCTYASGR